MGGSVGHDMRVWAQEGCGSGDSARRAGLAGTGKIEEMRLELSLGPVNFSKIRPCRPLNIPGPHIDNYQTPEVENPYSRYDIVEPLVANWLWAVVRLSDPKVPGAWVSV